MYRDFLNGYGWNGLLAPEDEAMDSLSQALAFSDVSSVLPLVFDVLAAPTVGPVFNTGDIAADTTTTASLTLGVQFTNELEVVGDRDWIAVSVTAGTTYAIDLFGADYVRTDGTTAFELRDTYLRLFDANGDLIDFNDDSGEGLFSFLAYTAEETGTVYVSVGAYFDDEAGGYGVLVEELTDDFAGNTTTTGVVTLGTSVSGSIDFDGDSDWFRFDVAQANDSFIFETVSDVFASIALYDADGNFLDAFGEAGGYAFGTPGTYYVAVEGFDRGDYTLDVTSAGVDVAGDTSTTATIVVDGAAVQGTHLGFDDADWFAFDASAGSTVLFAADSSRVQFFEIYDAQGNFIDSRFGDAAVFEFADAGSYFVNILGDTGTYSFTASTVDDDFAGNTSTTGALVDGESVMANFDFPFDIDWFAFEAVAGKIYSFTVDSEVFANFDGIYDEQGNYVDFPQGDSETGAVFFANLTGTYYLGVSGDGPSSYEVGFQTVVDEVGDDFGNATVLTSPATVTSDLYGNADTDVFRFDVVAGTQYMVELSATTTPDIFAELVRADGTTVGSVNLFTGNTVSYTSLTDTTLFLRIYGNGAQDYTLTLSDGSPVADPLPASDAIGDARDYAVDDVSGDVFVTTDGGALLRVDGETGETLEGFAIGGRLNGIVISADGTTAYVAQGEGRPVGGDGDFFFETESLIHTVDLSTGAVGEIVVQTDAFSTGGFAEIALGPDGDLVAVTNDGTAFRVDPDTGVSAPVAGVPSGIPPSLVTSDDGRYALITSDIFISEYELVDLEAGVTVTRGFYYNEVSQNSTQNGAINADLGLFAIGGTVYNFGGQRVADLALERTEDGFVASRNVIDVAFSPSGDRIYVLQSELGVIIDGGLDNQVEDGPVLFQLVAYDTTTFEEIATVDITQDLGETAAFGFFLGGSDYSHLTNIVVSDDGSVVIGGREGLQIVDPDLFGITLEGTDAGETLVGGAGADTLIGLDGDDTLIGLEGSDLLQGGAGADVIDGGEGRDTVSYADATQGVRVVLSRNFSDEGDRLISIENATGSVFADTLVSLTTGSTLRGLAGDDLLSGLEGADVMFGGSGNDRLLGRDGNDLLRGDEGDDLLVGGNGDDALVGGSGNDRLVGGEGRDTLVGDDGADVLSAGGGDDIIDGGAGNDTLVGDAGADILLGRTGDDRMIGGDGDDRLFGEEGADIMVGGLGNDDLQGGIGNDRMFGNEGRDDLNGGFGDDVMFGGADDDFLFGDEGADRLFGGAGDDVLNGGSGRNVLIGGEGNDMLVSQGSNDTLRGDAGNDLFQIGFNAFANRTVIADFTDGEDLVDLSDLGLFGSQTFEQAGISLRQAGDNLIMDFEFGGYVLLVGVDIANFDESDVLFDFFPAF